MLNFVRSNGFVVSLVCNVILGVSAWTLIQKDQHSGNEIHKELQKELQKKQIIIDIQDKRADILKDEIDHLEFKIISTRTYDEGYNEALVRMSQGTFADGFAAARKKYEQGDYVQGYHNALNQFYSMYESVPEIHRNLTKAILPKEEKQTKSENK